MVVRIANAVFAVALFILFFVTGCRGAIAFASASAVIFILSFFVYGKVTSLYTVFAFVYYFTLMSVYATVILLIMMTEDPISASMIVRLLDGIAKGSLIGAAMVMPLVAFIEKYIGS